MTTTKTKTYDMTDQPVRIVDSQRWVRVEFNQTYIANTTDAKLLIDYQNGLGVMYFIPTNDIEMQYLSPVESGGKYRLFDVVVDDQSSSRAAYKYKSVPDDRTELENHITFKWEAVDNWYEEEEQLIAHPRNPYHRVDPIPSLRHVKVVLDDEILAVSDKSYLCFETGLPIRFYFDQANIEMEKLTPTDKKTTCPYKGYASYWTVETAEDTYENLAWAYTDPLREATNIKNKIAFYNEKVDIYVDGELQPKPNIIYR